MEARLPSPRRIFGTSKQSSAAKFAENFDGWPPPEGSASIQPGLFGQDGAHGSSPMLFNHHHLEISRGFVFRLSFTVSR